MCLNESKLCYTGLRRPNSTTMAVRHCIENIFQSSPTTHILYSLSSLTNLIDFTQQSQNSNEIDEIVKSLKENPGFKAYLVLTLDGIVLRWDQEGEPMPYEKAVQYSHHVMDLFDKSKCHISELFEVSRLGRSVNVTESAQVM